MTKITRTAAVLTSAIMTRAVAGCGYPASYEPPGAAETPTPTVQFTESSTPEDATSEPGDPDELTATAPPLPEDEEVATIELGTEGSTLYLRALQAFSPELESWSVNADPIDRGALHASLLPRCDPGGGLRLARRR